MQYTLIKSKRRTLSVQIVKDGTVVVKAPNGFPQIKIDEFLAKKSAWIKQNSEKMKESAKMPKYSATEKENFLTTAKDFIPKKVAVFAKQVGVNYGKITVRLARTRWGSCAVSGNLSFNALLALLPEEISDYIILHELCHRKELNHSNRFWALLEKFCPRYRERREWLKINGYKFLNRL